MSFAGLDDYPPYSFQVQTHWQMPEDEFGIAYVELLNSSGAVVQRQVPRSTAWLTVDVNGLEVQAVAVDFAGNRGQASEFVDIAPYSGDPYDELYGPEPPTPDVPTPDAPVPDAPAPDAPAPDAPAPDAPAPDAPNPDARAPDAPAPDAPAPDAPAPDATAPEGLGPCFCARSSSAPRPSFAAFGLLCAVAVMRRRRTPVGRSFVASSDTSGHQPIEPEQAQRDSQSDGANNALG